MVVFVAIFVLFGLGVGSCFGSGAATPAPRALWASRDGPTDGSGASWGSAGLGSYVVEDFAQPVSGSGGGVVVDSFGRCFVSSSSVERELGVFYVKYRLAVVDGSSGEWLRPSTVVWKLRLSGSRSLSVFSTPTVALNSTTLLWGSADAGAGVFSTFAVDVPLDTSAHMRVLWSKEHTGLQCSDGWAHGAFSATGTITSKVLCSNVQNGSFALLQPISGDLSPWPVANTNSFNQGRELFPAPKSAKYPGANFLLSSSTGLGAEGMAVVDQSGTVLGTELPKHTILGLEAESQLLVATDGNSLVAVDTLSWKTLWHLPARVITANLANNSIIALFVDEGSDDHPTTLAAARFDTKDGTILWSTEIPFPPSQHPSTFAIPSPQPHHHTHSETASSSSTSSSSSSATTPSAPTSSSSSSSSTSSATTPSAPTSSSTSSPSSATSSSTSSPSSATSSSTSSPSSATSSSTSSPSSLPTSPSSSSPLSLYATQAVLDGQGNYFVVFGYTVYALHGSDGAPVGRWYSPFGAPSALALSRDHLLVKAASTLYLLRVSASPPPSASPSPTPTPSPTPKPLSEGGRDALIAVGSIVLCGCFGGLIWVYRNDQGNRSEEQDESTYLEFMDEDEEEEAGGGGGGGGGQLHHKAEPMLQQMEKEKQQAAAWRDEAL